MRSAGSSLSAEACALQSRASVGLAHAIAHQLEGPLGIGHARLVAAALPTVFGLAVAEAPRWPDVAAAHDLDAEQIIERLASLADSEDIVAMEAALPEYWPSILRDPLTRTNGFLVRRAHLGAFCGVASWRAPLPRARRCSIDPRLGRATTRSSATS